MKEYCWVTRRVSSSTFWADNQFHKRQFGQLQKNTAVDWLTDLVNVVSVKLKGSWHYVFKNLLNWWSNFNRREHMGGAIFTKFHIKVYLRVNLLEREGATTTKVHNGSLTRQSEGWRTNQASAIFRSKVCVVWNDVINAVSEKNACGPTGRKKEKNLQLREWNIINTTLWSQGREWLGSSTRKTSATKLNTIVSWTMSQDWSSNLCKYTTTGGDSQKTVFILEQRGCVAITVGLVRKCSVRSSEKRWIRVR